MSFDSNKIESLYPGAGSLVNEPMLIWKLPSNKQHMMSEVCSSGDYFAQEKIDGCLYTYVKGAGGQGYLFGRTVSKITGVLTEKGGNVPHIMQALDALPSNTVIIGEIYYNGCTAKDVVSVMGCLAEEAIRRQADPKGRGRIHYYIHDIVRYNNIDLAQTGALDRYKILKAIFCKHQLDQYDFLRLATIVEEGIEEEVSRILNNGGEGMVLKKKTAPYSYGKRPAWDTIKFKQMDDTDLVCTRCIDPTKEYTGKELEGWPYWIIEKQDNINKEIWHFYEKCLVGNKTAIRGINYRTIPVTKPYYLGWKSSIGVGAYDNNGNLVEIGTVSSGLTDEDKAAMGENPNAFVGKVVALHCMSIDRTSKTLRHPVFKSWRDDKNAKDCKLSEVFK